MTKIKAEIERLLWNKFIRIVLMNKKMELLEFALTLEI